MRSFRWLRYLSKRPQKVEEFSKAIRKESAESVLRKFMIPSVQSDELVTLSEELLPHITNHAYSIIQQHHILLIFSSRSIRYEPTLLKCIWNILKTDVPQILNSSTHDGLNLRITPSGLAFCTASTFSILSRMRLINDQQMLALAFGRCIELSSIMSLSAVSKTYEALGLLNREYFSLTDAYFYKSDMDSISSRNEVFDEAQLSDIANQPNMVDILCGELEARLAELSSLGNRLFTTNEGDKMAEIPWELSSDWPTTSLTVSTLDASGPHAGAGNCGEYAINGDLFSCLIIMRALPVLGAMSPDIFSSLRNVIASCMKGEGIAPSVEFLVQALKEVSRVHQRVVDPLNHEDNHEFPEARAEMIRFLASSLLSRKDLVLTLRRNPQLNLDMRKLFEESQTLVECAFHLWDRIRCIRIAHKHVTSKKKIQLPECQFMKGRNTKLKRITPDPSEAERFIPPQFKTWRSPEHSPRRNRSSSPGALKVIPFGRRRISKNYIKEKQRKYCPF
ncbi:unnamed protein product [Phytomonas sp. Hart1]|nr:unnamed protein product [Phytomonas sp. Hart1]|eukprot:CCW71138.1 unnamed protein product [Phytomonas sp. isolate Hart1]